MNEESLKTGLKIHKGETKLITNIDKTENIQDRTEIEVTNYKDLGQTIAMGNGTRQEVLTKIKAGWNVFGSTEKSFWTGTFL